MKGKVYSIKLVLMLMVVLTTCFCFAFGTVPKEKQNNNRVLAASTKVSLGETDREEYSALFGGNVIFSAEKVGVNSLEDSGYPKALTKSEKKTFLGAYEDSLGKEREYDFIDLPTPSSNKTVIDNGDFVKFDNIKQSNLYTMPSSSELQEAILVSFGSYVYFTETEEVKIANIDPLATPAVDNSVHAGISFLEVVAQRNGQTIPIPSVRNINIQSGGLYFDFVCLITQQDDNSNEGYYTFSFKYMVENVERTANFEFYVINNTSYTQNANPTGADYGYNAKPTLGWTGDVQFEQSTKTENYVRYYIGETGISGENISYPTITYDYTKYKLSYVHTANQRNTTYDFACITTEDMNGKRAKLVCTISQSGSTSTKEYVMQDYSNVSTIHLVTIMLTEPGTYTANYTYLYDGYNAGAVPELGFATDEIKLAIHGLSAQYSKTDYESAKMQYFELASNINNNVDLIVPNGYSVDDDISQLKNQKLGFVYKINNLTSYREGDVVKNTRQDSLINAALKADDNDGAKYGSSENAFDFLVSGTEVITLHGISKSNVVILNTILKNINYVQTNQGSLWIEGNDIYNADKSLYYYSPTKITAETLFALKDASGNDVNITGAINSVTSKNVENPFNNTTSFKSKGYYLVFLYISPTGLSVTNADYWQVFAFQYTSSSVDIEIKAVDNKGTPDVSDDTKEVVAGGKYTNKPVEISWIKPGIFDRGIKAYYYSVTNKNYSREQLLDTNKKELVATLSADGKNYIARLGSLSEVVVGNFEKYLIRLESEGLSATHKIFTVDRQDISGIRPYLISEMYSGNTLYYAYATDKDNYIIPIANGITDSYATLSWNDKLSGANITATYTYTPFSIDSSAQPATVTGVGGKEWTTTNYQLGTTILGADLKKASSIYNVDTDCILFNQGIYIITLNDEAGNSSVYAFIIDRTESYFKVENTFVSNSLVIYGDDVTYSLGDYKVFKLDTPGDATLKEFIEKAATKDLGTLENYYTGDNNNTYALSNLIQKLGEDYYFTVANNRVVAYENQYIDKTITGIRGQLTYVESTSSYYKRTLYVVAENHRYSANKDEKDNSYITVEINKDNARGMVYYSSSMIETIPADGQSGASIKRLDTGSDMFDENGNEIGNGLEAKLQISTSSKHVAFVWNSGSGNFEVESVKYDFYTLEPNIYQNSKYYFYNYSESGDLYKTGKYSNNAKALGDGRAFVSFNGSNLSKAGLYVITRTYKDVPGDDFGEDVKVKNYYFIVDRNGIIDTVLGIGGSIKINLMEGEEEFNNFSTQNTEKQPFTYGKDDIYNASYNVYLTTTKLPAILNIPVGKYFTDDGTSANYTAGQLNVSIYYYDYYNQFKDLYTANGSYNKITKKIYDSLELVNNSLLQVSADGVFVIDIYDYLSNVDKELRDRITESDQNGTWMFLSGDYIIRITDNVIDELGNVHEKYIGLRISGVVDKGPQVESNTGFSKTDMTEISVTGNRTNYTARVSQEYLNVVLPSYDAGIVNKAQVDPSYIVVTQDYDGRHSNYLIHEYTPQSGINLRENSEYVTIDDRGTADPKDDVTNVWLDTKLRTNGEIDLANLNKSLSYTITVRYKLSNGSGTNDKYKNCYVVYTETGVKEYYFQATYTITIDREAPGNNIVELNKNDILVQDYNTDFGTAEMMERGFHQTTSNLYFTKQYAKYYQENKHEKGYIYAYQVDDTTAFDFTDVKNVYAREIVDLSSYNLTLPMINANLYPIQMSANTFIGYAGLGLKPNTYNEIIEMDEAGNTTQYVVHYLPADAIINIPIYTTTTVGKNESGNITFDGFELSDGSATKLALSIFEIFENGNTIVDFDKFFKIELEKASGENVLTLLTNATYNFNSITSKVVDALNNSATGQFNLIITTRTVENVIYIDKYSANASNELNVVKLYKDENNNFYKDPAGQYYINLLAANYYDESSDVWYFATDILITAKGAVETITRYVGQRNNAGEINYYLYEDYQQSLIDPTFVLSRYGTHPCEENTTYHIVVTDLFGKEYSVRFNTVGDGYEFVVIEFEDIDADATNDYYVGTDGVYYGYTTATIKYDKIYTANITLLSSVETHLQDTPATGYNVVTINTIYNEETGLGGLVQYKVELKYNGETESTYYITLDTRLSNVALRDATSGERRDIIKPFNNADYFSGSVRSDQTASGVLNLNWDTIAENDYFDYEYRLYEFLKDGTYRLGSDGQVGKDLTGHTSESIATRNDSTGIYKFEIRIYGKDGTYLGNRIYAFEVQEISNQIYRVRYFDEELERYVEVNPNSSFTVNELTRFSTKITNAFNKINTQLSLPLYITNRDLDVIVTMVNVNKDSLILENSSTGLYDFVVYRIYKENSYDIYFGILKIKQSPSLVNSVSLISNGDYASTTLITTATSLTVADSKNSEIKVQAIKSTAISDDLLKKNMLTIEVYYINELIAVEPFENPNSAICEYIIKGNGQYSFIIKDAAGNTHTYENDESVLDVYVLREVVVTLNDQAPIENAFYNDAVNLIVYSSMKYVTGSVQVSALKNGVTYEPEGYNPYVFKDYGNYRVSIKASYSLGANTIELTKVVTFTIINVKESRKSIDLTALSGSKITKVLNMNNVDVTDAFVDIINSSETGMNISYEDVIKNSNKLKVSAGKLAFTITYCVNDGVYPERSIDLSFTLNDENPTIPCTLRKGETTKKSFDIYFNPAIIYEQIGEAYVYINDEVVAHITELSANEELRITTSYKENGDGDYYVRLISSSGVVLDSYKVTIKEPLNAMAILVIVIVVGVVATVVITIIVLRRKMRIR